MDAPRFRRVKWQQAYDVTEVDAFVDRLQLTVDGLAGGDPVTADEIRKIQFRGSGLFREGYDVQEVDMFLDRAESLLS